MDTNDSLSISGARLPLAIMVVALHSYVAIDGWDYFHLENNGIGSNVAQFFMIALSRVIAHIAVPLFFLISGFLFYQNLESGNLHVWRRKFSSRFRSLFLPYVLWIVLYILFLFLREGGLTIISQGYLYEWWQSKGGIRMFWCSEKWNLDRLDIWGRPFISSAPVLISFWFVRDLMACIVISPLFFILFKKTSPNWLVVVSVAVISILYFTQTSLPITALSALSVFYWAVGAYLSIRKKGIVHTFTSCRSVIIPVFAVLLIAQIALDGHNTFYGNILYPFFVFTGVAFFWNLKIGKGASAAYPGLPFFLFASHLFVLDYVRRGVNFLLRVFTWAVSANNLDFANQHPFLVILSYCSTIGLTVMVCTLLYMALNRFSPRFCQVLCGR